MKKTSGINVTHVSVKWNRHKITCIILSPKGQTGELPGVLWIHGGGYLSGMKEMVFRSRMLELVRQSKAVVISPGYRLAWYKPYPAAVEDCYQTLLYLKENAGRLSVRKNQIFVGGESAGGGLAAAVCMMARDKGTVKIAYQMPLYPMLDNLDTENSKNNHGRVWNTRRNHLAWRLYLRSRAKMSVSPYASPARQTDYRDLPPAYTFVGTGEPFFAETKTYVENLKKCGIPARIDIYDMDMHAFDMLKPGWEVSKQAASRFNEQFYYASEHYFAE